jgi:hypothetical protein
MENEYMLSMESVSKQFPAGDLVAIQGVGGLGHLVGADFLIDGGVTAISPVGA